MKKIGLVMLALLLCSTLAFAEATFDQIQGLIKAHDYAAAVQGLNLIIQNHPRSAKAYYAMSQAQAGIGNQAKAKEALDMATGIDPSLKFASSGNVKNLKEAIQPQTNKIEPVESHKLGIFLLLVCLLGGVFLFMTYPWKKKGPKPEAEKAMPDPVTPRQPYSPSSVQPYAARPISSGYVQRSDCRPYSPAPVAPVHHTTVVNNSGHNDLVTGMVLGNMLAGSHEHRTVVEREYIPVREEAAVRSEPSRASSWDDSREESKSSSWDSGSSSSNSWDSGSNSSSSSWDSGSSSDSSSSWD